jgi:choline-sulfatase
MYTQDDAPHPEKCAEELDWLPATLRKGGYRRHVEEFPDPATLALSWAYYFGAISFIDSWIGVILDELERLGLREDTLVLYTSDHGELLGDHWGAGKDCFYEGAARVPLVVSWPGRLPAGAVREPLAGLTDVVPTILDAAGIGREPAAALGLEPNGVSLLPAARDGAPTRDVLVGLVGQGVHAHLAAITPEWKYIYSAADNRELLFRYRQPGGELRDLAGAPNGDSSTQEICTTLRGVVQERLRAAGARPAADLHDPGRPTGFRLIAGGHAAQRRGAVEDSHWLRRAQYPGWVARMPANWQPPPPRGDAIPADHPLRSDRALYSWAPHGPTIDR